MTPSLYKKHTPFFIATLPLPPGINGSHATRRRTGRIMLTAEARQFKNDAALLLKQAKVADWDTITTIKQSKRAMIPLYLSLSFYFPTRRRDVDGPVKITQDAVCDYLGINDNRIVWLEAWKIVDKHCPRVEIEVSLVAVEEVA